MRWRVRSVCDRLHPHPRRFPHDLRQLKTSFALFLLCKWISWSRFRKIQSSSTGLIPGKHSIGSRKHFFMIFKLFKCVRCVWINSLIVVWNFHSRVWYKIWSVSLGIKSLKFGKVFTSASRSLSPSVVKVSVELLGNLVIKFLWKKFQFSYFWSIISLSVRWPSNSSIVLLPICGLLKWKIN